MLEAVWKITKPPRLIWRSYSTLRGGSVSAVDTIVGHFDNIDINEFRQRAFTTEKPILVTPRHGMRSTDCSIPQWTWVPTSVTADMRRSCFPAAHKWFSRATDHTNTFTSTQPVELSHQYLSAFSDIILPYELIVDARQDYLRSWVENHGAGDGNQGLATIMRQLLEISEGRSFHRFDAPLSLFLQACKSSSSTLPRLYIAQAQIAYLPKELQDDLPTPRLVREAGKGDIYDTNIWMGIPPTYTPLHRDPNPNLFVQLASNKKVRLFTPNAGATIFRNVQQSIGQQSPANFRGQEMMEGPERDALDEAVWGDYASIEGLEADVAPGDALFIPKGWWHSMKSVGTEVTASVNWWFR